MTSFLRTFVTKNISTVFLGAKCITKQNELHICQLLHRYCQSNKRPNPIYRAAGNRPGDNVTAGRHKCVVILRDPKQNRAKNLTFISKQVCLSKIHPHYWHHNIYPLLVRCIVPHMQTYTHAVQPCARARTRTHTNNAGLQNQS